jgi:hypothetical protein
MGAECRKYQTFPQTPLYDEERKCISSLNCESNCNCWDEIVNSMFNYGVPINQGGTLVQYIYTKPVNACNYYGNGSRYPYEIKVFGIPILTRNDSLSFGNCESDKRRIGANLVKEIQKKEEELARKENLLLPKGCMEDLEKEANDKNLADKEQIDLGCKAPWVIVEDGPYDEENPATSNGTPPCGGFNCKTNIKIPYTSFTVKPDPEWKPPVPKPEGCAPPPPPPPPPPPATPPPVPTDCINGGETDGTPDTGGGFPGGGGQQD